MAARGGPGTPGADWIAVALCYAGFSLLALAVLIIPWRAQATGVASLTLAGMVAVFVGLVLGSSLPAVPARVSRGSRGLISRDRPRYWGVALLRAPRPALRLSGGPRSPP